MKIGAFTIISIIFFLTLLFVTYLAKQTVDMQRDLCSNLAKDQSDSVDELLKDCFYNSQISSTGYSSKLLGTTLFLFLIFISWRIDNLEKHQV